MLSAFETDYDEGDSEGDNQNAYGVHGTLLPMVESIPAGG